MKDFLHAVWESACFSPGDSRCCIGLLLTLSKSDNIQGCINPRVKGSFSSVANKSEISSVMCAAVEPMFNKGAVLKPEIAHFASNGVVLHFPFPKA